MRTKSRISAYILRGSAAALLLSCVIVALSSAINLPRRHPAPPAPENGHQRERTLTFADRVAYQRAIEEVYWRHRIWPAANAAPKPPLDKVMSQAQIEKKVEDYLRDSQALEDYWQRPITPDQLQAEMERIASHSKQPEVLRELFAALGNDPFVIAECLARSVLAERLLTELYAHDQRFHGDLKRRAEAELRTHRSVTQMKQTSGTYTEMEWIKSDSPDPVAAGVPPAQPTRLPPQKPADAKSVGVVKMNSSEWQESVEKLAAQFQSQEIVGQAPRLPNRGLAAGAAALQKLPIAQIKTGVLSPLQEDDAHYYAVAVMKKGNNRLKLATIAWLKEPLRSWLAKAEPQVPVTMAAMSNYMLPAIASPSGGCTDNTWTPTSITNVPDARELHTAVWTGSEMIIWGGLQNVNPTYLNSGGRYDPSTDTWTATSAVNAPSARSEHTAVWTGSEMIIWGGVNYPSYLNSGGRYNPSTDTWTATSPTNAPTGRSIHTAVWTGNEMIVWGGWTGNQFFNSGGRYDPGTDSWISTSTTNAPSARWQHTAVWTGSEMIIWGGDGNSGAVNTGGRYNPTTDSWTATITTNAPDTRFAHTAVWTGSEMIVWGGFSDTQFELNTGGRYTPDTDNWVPTSTINVPHARRLHTAVWTSNEMIVWGGRGGGNVPLNTGGRYNPGADSWMATSVVNTPSARFGHTAAWAGSEMIVWGGYNYANTMDTGGRYCAHLAPPTPTATASPTPTPTATSTATPTASPTPTPTPLSCTDDTWTPTNLTNAPAGRNLHTAVWTGSEMIVWGGLVLDNTGGRYNPSTDSWTPTNTNGAPDGRQGPTAVWTGSEMIVWGGYNGTPNLNTGGRYNPATDSWTATSTTNAPEPRTEHTAVWTGSEMIVWGGADPFSTYLNTGGRYNPSTDSWTTTSTTGAPAARYIHTAVWTGSEMIVWGGIGSGYLNTGGRYSPNADSWTATSTAGAPTARENHTAVWAGNQMIVWGGCSDFGCLNVLDTGGRYNRSADSWTATSTTGGPGFRYLHTAVWTGSEMIIWGGQGLFNNLLNTGGRYTPETDSWRATSTINAAEPRARHTAVWTGSQMIVWGGTGSGGGLTTGGRYCAVAPSPSPTPTATPTATPSPTPRLCDSGIIINGGFETGFFDGWIIIDPGNPEPVVTDTRHRSGNYSAFAGGNPAQFCGNGTEVAGNSSFFQPFTVPAAGGTLSFWHWDCTTDNIASDWQDAYITDSNSNILQTIFHQCQNGQTWLNTTVDMTAYAGMPVGIRFLVHHDSDGNLTGMYVDDVALYVQCATPTPTASPTPTATPTPTPTPTSCTGRCSPTPRPCPTSAGRPTPPPRLTPPPNASPSVTPAPRPTPPPRLTPPPTPTGSPRPTPRPRP